jgi:hypothetical protein
MLPQALAPGKSCLHLEIAFALIEHFWLNLEQTNCTRVACRTRKITQNANAFSILRVYQHGSLRCYGFRQKAWSIKLTTGVHLRTDSVTPVVGIRGCNKPIVMTVRLQPLGVLHLNCEKMH